MTNLGLKYLQNGKTDQELMDMEKVDWRRYLLNRIRRIELIVAAGIIAEFMDLKFDTLLEIIQSLF